MEKLTKPLVLLFAVFFLIRLGNSMAVAAESPVEDEIRLENSREVIRAEGEKLLRQCHYTGRVMGVSGCNYLFYRYGYFDELQLFYTTLACALTAVITFYYIAEVFILGCAHCRLFFKMERRQRQAGY